MKNFLLLCIIFGIICFSLQTSLQKAKKVKQYDPTYSSGPNYGGVPNYNTGGGDSYDDKKEDNYDDQKDDNYNNNADNYDKNDNSNNYDNYDYSKPNTKIKEQDDAYVAASYSKSTKESAEKVKNYAPKDQQPGWLKAYGEKNIWPFAWTVYDTAKDSAIDNYNFYLYLPQAHYFVNKCISTWKGDYIYNVFQAKVVYVTKYAKDQWRCFTAQDLYEKNRYLSVCLDTYKYKLHVAAYYDYYAKKWDDIGYDSTYYMSQW